MFFHSLNIFLISINKNAITKTNLKFQLVRRLDACIYLEMIIESKHLHAKTLDYFRRLISMKNQQYYFIACETSLGYFHAATKHAPTVFYI